MASQAHENGADKGTGTSRSETRVQRADVTGPVLCSLASGLRRVLGQGCVLANGPESPSYLHIAEEGKTTIL